ncbi:MAG: endolytic transglycosylase MltG [Lachnospiraceae bacterium]|nr:endolytic transglycosylase MltG [Lachnospiraceae bacterium]
MIRKAAGLIISISLQMIVCALVVIFLYDAGVKGFAFGESIFSNAAVSSPGNGRDMIVIIEKGASDLDVAKLLESKGLIEDYKVFLVQTVLYKATLYPGTYTLNTSMTPEEMLDILMQESKTEEEK